MWATVRIFLLHLPNVFIWKDKKLPWNRTFYFVITTYYLVIMTVTRKLLRLIISLLRLFNSLLRIIVSLSRLFIFFTLIWPFRLSFHDTAYNNKNFECTTGWRQIWLIRPTPLFYHIFIFFSNKVKWSRVKNTILPNCYGCLKAYDTSIWIWF